MRYVLWSDNLPVLRQIPRGTVDLCFMDPPFSSGLFFDPKPRKGIEKAADAGSSSGLLEMLEPRIKVAWNALQPNGIMCILVDWTIDASLRVLVEKMFGWRSFLTHIILTSQRRPLSTDRWRFPTRHESLLVFAKGDTFTLNRSILVRSSDREPTQRQREQYKYAEPDTGRRFRLVPLTVQGPVVGGFEQEFLGISARWRFSNEKLQQLWSQGMIYQADERSKPYLKQYFDESTGRQLDNIWDDITTTNTNPDETTGYASQRPSMLLERIIGLFSNEGDLVVDPFAGSGTTLVAAERLGRRWLGIDNSLQACRITSERLWNGGSIEGVDHVIASWRNDLSPRHLSDLAALPVFEFQSWAVTFGAALLNSQPLNVPDFQSRYVRLFPINERMPRQFDTASSLPVTRIPLLAKNTEAVTEKDIFGLLDMFRGQEFRHVCILALDVDETAKAHLDRARYELGINLILLDPGDVLGFAAKLTKQARAAIKQGK